MGSHSRSRKLARNRVAVFSCMKILQYILMLQGSVVCDLARSMSLANASLAKPVLINTQTRSRDLQCRYRIPVPRKLYLTYSHISACNHDLPCSVGPNTYIVISGPLVADLTKESRLKSPYYTVRSLEPHH